MLIDLNYYEVNLIMYIVIIPRQGAREGIWHGWHLSSLVDRNAPLLEGIVLWFKISSPICAIPSSALVNQGVCSLATSLYSDRNNLSLFRTVTCNHFDNGDTWLIVFW